MASLGEGGGGLLALASMETPVVSSAVERYHMQNKSQVHLISMTTTHNQTINKL